MVSYAYLMLFVMFGLITRPFFPKASGRVLPENRFYTYTWILALANVHLYTYTCASHRRFASDASEQVKVTCDSHRRSLVMVTGHFQVKVTCDSHRRSLVMVTGDFQVKVTCDRHGRLPK